MARILIVDDDPEALALAEARLSNAGVEILCAGTGEAGLQAAKAMASDVILLDVDMPGLSGFDVCRALKEDPHTALIPVLFLSGSGSSEDKVKGLDLGAIDYVTKPFEAFELCARVRAALRTKQLQDLLIERAHLDPLTGLPNRRALEERLHQEWNRRQRHGSALALVMADVDRFKQVNDTYGHGVGDQVLREVGQVIAQQCRDVDLPVRFGGEEFAIVVPEATASGAACLAERCRAQIADLRLTLNGGVLRPSASFGVADATELASPRALLERADQALYAAKRNGRNRVELWSRTL